MVDLVRYNRIVLVSRVRGDEVSDPSSGCTQFACKIKTKIRRFSCALSALLLHTLGSVLDKVQVSANFATGDVIDIQRVQVGVDDSHQTGERVLKRRTISLNFLLSGWNEAHLSVDDLVDCHLFHFLTRRSGISILIRARRPRRRRARRSPVCRSTFALPFPIEPGSRGRGWSATPVVVRGRSTEREDPFPEVKEFRSGSVPFLRSLHVDIDLQRNQRKGQLATK